MSVLIALSECGSSSILRVFLFLKEIMNIIFVIVPIGLIVIFTIDFSKAVISGDPDNNKKVTKTAANRLLSAIILFSMPWIVSIFITLLGGLGVDSVSCVTMVDKETINQLAANEKIEQKAKEEARLAEIKERNASLKERKNSHSYYNISNNTIVTPTASGCDGVVYYENGNFYKPESNTYNGKDKSKGSATAGYNKYFFELLENFTAAAKKAGYDITYSTNTSGCNGAWRSLSGQQACKDYWISQGNPNNAATVGTSNHGWGVASDLDYPSDKRSAAVSWAKDNASKYNLEFTVPGEDWHIAPVYLYSDDEKVKKCL